MNIKCKEIRELILTDYLDNEISDKNRIRLNIHFARCKDCKEFYERVKLTLVQPFNGLEKQIPSESVWQNVKQSIVVEQQERPGVVFSLLNKLRSLIFVRRPAFAISTVMALVLIVGVVIKVGLNSNEGLSGSAQGQMENSAYSIEMPFAVLANGDYSLGTSIEEYFLQN
jgi:predicted anti-sigma-YlaC factor YlaD